MTLKAVVFDLGGTLMRAREGTTPEEDLARSAPAAMRFLPPEQAARLDSHVVGTAVRQAYLALEDAACGGDLSPVPADLVIRKAMMSLGVLVDTTQAQAMLAALYVPARNTTEMLDGALRAIRTLKEMGLRLGVISNRMHGGTQLRDDLTSLGLGDAFSMIVASSDVGQMKPHAAIFRGALNALGVDAGEAVMVGDDLRADIKGALAVGMKAIWVYSPKHHNAGVPVGVPTVRHLDELVPTIKRMMSTAE